MISKQNDSAFLFKTFEHLATKFNFTPYRYARAYTGIQFFDPDSLLPPPFTFLSVTVSDVNVA
jgi:hypothetical protein